MRVSHAVTPIHLCDANRAKTAVLDALAVEYVRLCQQYRTALCTAAPPDTYATLCLDSPRSQRWERVTIQQAGDIAQSWRRNFAAASQEHAPPALRMCGASVLLACTAPEQCWLLNWDQHHCHSARPTGRRVLDSAPPAP
jgi:hypothetical protein